MSDGLCWKCSPSRDGIERTQGWCASCGFFFDRYGIAILEPWRTCPVHPELLASCPHSGSLL